MKQSQRKQQKKLTAKKHKELLQNLQKKAALRHAAEQDIVVAPLRKRLMQSDLSSDENRMKKSAKKGRDNDIRGRAGAGAPLQTAPVVSTPLLPPIVAETEVVVATVTATETATFTADDALATKTTKNDARRPLLLSHALLQQALKLLEDRKFDLTMIQSMK